MFRNLIGAWLALAWLPSTATGRSRVNRALLWVPRLLVVALLTFELGTVALVAGQQFVLARQLPAVYEFDNPKAIAYWSGNIKPVPEHGDQGKHSLKIQLSTSYYSGVALNNLPWDWRDYDVLTIAFYNPGENLTLTLRINDERHDRTGAHYNDRFNTRLHLTHGDNKFQVSLSAIAEAPDSREMALGKIRRMGLFATGLKVSRQIYLTRLELK
jgi:hypothetical protein